MSKLMFLCGFAGLASYLMWSYAHPGDVRRWFVGALEANYSELGYSLREHGYSERIIKSDALIKYFDNTHHWLTWYYSPLNIWYWAVAMLCFTPALTFHLIAKHFLW